ncbi:MAG: aquaporin family protein [Ktedonobacteraceae bacterium]|nr:aquaporin family protein [Ktedonobacteraceae bacterium]
MQKEISIWQIFVAELIGTAILVLVGIGSIPATLVLLVSSGGKAAFTIADRGMIALTVGFIIAAAIYSLGHISGGHVNPSVTFALAVTKRLPWRLAGVYFVAQLIGSVIGAIGILLFIGLPAARQVGLGQNVFAPGTSYIQAFFAEVVAAFILLFIVGGCLFDRRAPAGWGGLVVAVTIFAEIVALVNPSSLSLNFARTFGPAIVMLFVNPSLQDLTQVFTVFLFGPLIGAALGALTYDFIAGLRVTAATPEETVGGIEKTAVEGVAAVLESSKDAVKTTSAGKERVADSRTI